MEINIEILNNIWNFIKTNWKDIITISAFILSFFNFTYLVKTNFKSVSIKEIFYTNLKFNKKNQYEFNMFLINKSRQPLSIVDISFENNKKIYNSKLDKTIVSVKSSKDTKTTYYSSEFPINLKSLESSKELILFTLDEELEKEKITFTITTNRGVIKKKVNFENKFITPEEYLERIMKNA